MPWIRCLSQAQLASDQHWGLRVFVLWGGHKCIEVQAAGAKGGGGGDWGGGGRLVLVLAGPRPMAPPSQGVQGLRHVLRGLPHSRPLHMGAAHVVVRPGVWYAPGFGMPRDLVCPGIWYAPGIDLAIPRVLCACPTAGPTATAGEGGWGGGGGGDPPPCQLKSDNFGRPKKKIIFVGNTKNNGEGEFFRRLGRGGGGDLGLGGGDLLKKCVFLCVPAPQPSPSCAPCPLVGAVPASAASAGLPGLT